MCYGHRVTIEAPPEVVWDFVSDFTGWGSWNPLYGDTVGVAEVGQTLHCLVNLEGMKPQKFQAQVYRVVPNELLEYGVSSLGGLIKVYRYIQIEELSPIRCRVANVEIMGGLIGQQVLARLIGAKAASGMRTMNEALKFIAERKWCRRPI